MIKIAAAGFMCIDYWPQFDDRYYVTGNGVDVLFNLLDMRNDIAPSVVSVIGDDEYGKKAVAAFAERNFDTSHLEIVPGGATTTFEMLLKGNDRFHNHCEPGVLEGYEFSADAIEFLGKQDYVHTDFTGHLERRLSEITAYGAKIFFDFSKAQGEDHELTDSIFKDVEIGIASFEEDFEGGKAFLERGIRLGAHILIATFGENGSLVYDGEQFYKGEIVPAEKVVNTVGAGDSFFAGFIHAYLDHKTIPECIRSGAERSSKVISVWDPYL